MEKGTPIQVNNLSELKGKVEEFKYDKMEGSDFWEKPTSDVFSWKSFKDSKMGHVFDGSSIDGKEQVIVTSPIGEETQIVWSDSCKDCLFLFSLIEEISDDGDTIKQSISPLAMINIPKKVLDKKGMDADTLRIFTFNLMEMLRNDISDGNVHAIEFVQDWGRDNKYSKKFIKLAIQSRRATSDNIIEDLIELVKDEKRFKEAFPDIMTFSEWKKSEGIESNDEIIGAKKKVTDEMRKYGVDVNEMGEA